MSLAPRAKDASLPRFLLVTPQRSTPVEQGLGRFVALGCSLARVASVLEAERHGEADFVLFDLACGRVELGALRARLPEALVMVFGPPAAEAAAEEALAQGAHAWLRTGGDGELDEEAVFDAVERLLVLGPRPALPKERARRRRTSPAELMRVEEPPRTERAAERQAEPAGTAAEAPPPPAPATEPPAALPAPAPRAAAPLRMARAPRLVKLYEVEGDGGPARRPPPVVERLELFGEHIEVRLDCVEPLRSEVVVTGFETPGGLRWASFGVLRARPAGAERVEAELSLLQGAGDFFRPAALLPVFDASRMRYAKPELGARAAAWVELGVLREVELDRVLVCPRCQSLPTFRLACRRCSSARIDGQRLIHHFPCAHVGFVRDYQVDGTLVCPKCGGHPLIVNSDFEYLDGPAHCAECGSGEADGELVGHCFGCGVRFLARVAATHALKGFHADRLDPVDLGLPAV